MLPCTDHTIAGHRPPGGRTRCPPSLLLLSVALQRKDHSGSATTAGRPHHLVDGKFHLEVAWWLVIRCRVGGQLRQGTGRQDAILASGLKALPGLELQDRQILCVGLLVDVAHGAGEAVHLDSQSLLVRGKLLLVVASHGLCITQSHQGFLNLLELLFHGHCCGVIGRHGG